MLNFEFILPTKIIFGPGEIIKLGKEVKNIGRKPLLITGKTAMRKTGILDRVLDILDRVNIKPVLFENIEPNPHAKTVDEAARIARDEGCDMVIGLGGGSTMDAAKGIAAAAMSKRPVWDHIYSGDGETYIPIRKALPIVCVPTIAATGSEADSGGVITNTDTNEKTGIFGKPLFPTLSIVDPELTFTCPKDYTIDGGIDIITHVIESYFTGTDTAYLQDRFSESIIRTVIHYLPMAIANPEHLEARSHLSWCSTVALSGMVNQGRGGTFPLHALEHAVSGHYDISHGRGLALLLPALMEYTMPARPRKFIELGRNIFDIQFTSESEEHAALQSIEAMKSFLASVNRHIHFSDLDIDDSKFEKMADDIIKIYGRGKNYLENPRPIDKAGILEIFRNSL
ncbi:MAG: iron-containing alcohol dehydrogenase [candidate division Zixibacteria bacterium]|nr:iron-containing alcohol dehydrogenase [candidate division Zixibacteria bacterium]